jgi:hypothetical protein
VGFGSVASMADSWDAGRVWRQHWHKTSSPVTPSGGLFSDLSMAAGTPKYNAYVGAQLEFTPLVGASNAGINTGGTADKWITRWAAGGSGVGNTLLPATLFLLDYNGFYPLVDMDDTEYQTFDNTNYATRYASGMRCMVVTTTPQSAGSPIQVLLDYTDSKGVAATASFFVNAAVNVGQMNCFSSSNNTSGFTSPFVPLAPGTIDMQQLIGVQLLNSAGGFCSFVLVKPILEATVVDSITPYELEFPRNGPMPCVPSGAYLNHIACVYQAANNGSLVRGCISFVKET